MTEGVAGLFRSRTAIVVTLLAIAVLAPSGAWWVSGTRQAENRAAKLIQGAEFEAQRRTEEEASRLGRRLELLREAEENRPFYHYQNLYHDPRGAAEGLSVIPSPLADGSADPLIGAYFQIDSEGRVTLPTVNDELPELSTEDGFATYCAFLADLEDAAMLVEPNAEQGMRRDGALFLEHERVRTSPFQDERVVTLAFSQWQQIDEANRVYAQLAGRPSVDAARPIRQGRESEARVEIRVGALRWTTLLVATGPVLAGLRQVTTPSGILVQGFSIEPDEALTIAGVSRSNTMHAEGDSDRRFRAQVGATGWALDTDASEAMTEARRSADVVQREFTKAFSFVFGAALIAAACVALLVAQAESLAKQRTRFAAAAAHELKTPLATLQLYSEMLAEGLGDEGRRQTYARRLVAETSRLGRVVMNILDLSRLERGGLLVEVAAGDLGSVVEQCIEGLRPNLEHNGLQVRWDRGDGLPEALFDPDAVRQIVANVLDNAERYTRDSVDRAVDISLRGCAEWVVLQAADNGPGVGEGVRQRMFKPFARGIDRGGPAGLGLGLALARSLARAQGGDLVLATSSAHEGAVFELRLPVAG